MTAALGTVLPFAVGIAISPIPIIAIVVILFSARARVNGPVFLLGWASGLTVLSIIVYAVTSTATSGSAGTSTTSWWRVALGAALIALAVRKFRGANDGDEPAWMRSVDHITPGRAFVLAALLSSVNPKNLALTIGGISALAALAPPTNQAVAGVAVFVLLASSSIGAAVAYAFLGGQAATRNLERLRAWMDLHNNAVMGVLLAIIGVVLISNGLGA